MNEYGSLPLPYPDELLYGVITRYHLRMNNSSPKWTLREVYGTENVIPTLDLPSHLDDVTERSSQTGMSSDQWIDEHTLYSFYAPFLPIERSKRLKQLMKSKHGSGIHTLVGITASTIDRSGEFKFCPDCYEADIKQFGEPYWHRIHQITGVMVCPFHCVLLHRIIYPVAERHGLTVLPISRYLFKSQQVQKDLSDKLKLKLFDIALDVQQLISVGKSLDLYNLRKSLLYKLNEHGCLTPGKHIRQSKLEDQIRGYYGRELLEMLDCMIYGEYYSWLAVAARKARRAVHPLRHLLLIHFLFGSFSDFLGQMKTVYSPFGEGPWPCLNKAADHYKESVIEGIRITRCTDTGNPVGTFTCRCGFSYSRRGPDHNMEDRLRIGRIKAFGHVWMNQLENHMQNGLSYRATAGKLGVDTKTIIKYARYDQEIQKACPEESPPSQKSIKVQHRRMRLASGYVRIDWEKRDLALSWEVEEACKTLLDERDTKPVRITIASIGKRIGRLSLLEKHKEKLPVTIGILSNYLESVEQFQIRRVRWAVEQMKDEFPIKRWKLVRKAGLRPGYSQTVSEVLECYSGYGLHTLEYTNEVTTQCVQ
ncbi:TnsD family Tn7-like transposition protein [Paenibacillus sp. 2TAB23]|uniref:TnsD family Tn7-like transposition protein n=1 Tax=Paenibacillus sp. 2TAB23 TaxID=3233004 RepID=UPI003F9DCA83